MPISWVNEHSIDLAGIHFSHICSECRVLKSAMNSIFLAFVYRICELFIFSFSNEVQIRLQWRSWFKMLWDNVIYLEIDVHARLLVIFFFYSWWCWSCTRLTGSCARCTVKICNQHRYSTLSVVVVVFVVSLSRSHSLCVYFFYIHCAWFLFDVPCKTGFGK